MAEGGSDATLRQKRNHPSLVQLRLLIHALPDRNTSNAGPQPFASSSSARLPIPNQTNSLARLARR